MADSQRERLGREDKPACFTTDEQWFEWCMHEVEKPVPHSSYCYDCTPGHQAKMILRQSCEHPLTAFRASIGRRPRRAPPR
jgi:hypothetical protein